MKIAIFSMGPVFQETVHGGSQKTLRDLALYLGENGHTCKLYCTQRSDNFLPFQLSKNVHVFPILKFKETYPEPYYSAPYNLRNVINTLKGAISESDVFYIHDAELLYHFVYEDVPTVVAFQDFVYPDTLAGCMSYRRDRLIVTSEYVRRSVLAVFNEFCALDLTQVGLIPNGFDCEVFRRRPAEILRKNLGLPSDVLALLYPHRPDPRKGIFECIEVLVRLRELLPTGVFERVRLLIPRWMDTEVAKDQGHIYQNLYSNIVVRAEELGIAEHLVVHDWMPINRMPEYYSLGSATLCIGNFIEAFGNVSVESELCGTPAIVSRVGAQRTVLPDNLTCKVDYGDLQTAAEKIAAILLGQPNNCEDVRNYVRTQYDLSTTLSAYMETIAGCRLEKRIMERRPQPLQRHDALAVPPWCALLRRGYYNDYEYGYVENDRLAAVARSLSVIPRTIADLVGTGFPETELYDWFWAGHLIRTT